MPTPPRPALPDPTTALAAWRATHPAATLAEIEHEVDRQLSAIRTALITDLAHTAPPDSDRPVCPDCGASLQRVGERGRTVRTVHEGTLTFTAPAYRCPACGAGLSPPR